MRNYRQIFRSCLGLLPFLLTLGCFSPVKYGVNSELGKIEDAYGDIALPGEVHDRWWVLYGDEGLVEFVDTVLDNSPTLQVAYLRLLDSELALDQSKSAYYPSLSMNAGVGGSGTLYPDATAEPNYSLGLSASYEIDLSLIHI